MAHSIFDKPELEWTVEDIIKKWFNAEFLLMRIDITVSIEHEGDYIEYNLKEYVKKQLRELELDIELEARYFTEFVHNHIKDVQKWLRTVSTTHTPETHTDMAAEIEPQVSKFVDGFVSKCIQHVEILAKVPVEKYKLGNTLSKAIVFEHMSRTPRLMHRDNLETIAMHFDDQFLDMHHLFGDADPTFAADNEERKHFVAQTKQNFLNSYEKIQNEKSATNRTPSLGQHKNWEARKENHFADMVAAFNSYGVKKFKRTRVVCIFFILSFYLVVYILLYVALNAMITSA